MHNPEFAPFPTEEYLARYEKARELMAEKGMDALVVTGKENVVYFSGIQTIGWYSKHRPLGVVLPHGADRKPMIVLHESLLSVARETSWIEDVCPWGGKRFSQEPPDPAGGFRKALSDLDLVHSTIGMELGYGHRLGISHTDFMTLKCSVAEAKFVDGSDLLWELRMIKSLREIEALRKACEATTAAFEEGFDSLRVGMTEKELAGIMFARMAKETHERPGFVMIRSGPRKYGMVNVEPFYKPIHRGELIVVDAGALYKDYWADFMRMACMGPVTAEQRRFFEAEVESLQAGVKVTRPGVTTGEIFEACFSVLLTRGFGEYLALERVGHSLGLDMHEPPSIARGGTIVVKAGMVLTIEPIFSDRPNYRIGNFGLEDVVLVTETGCEILSHFPKELHVVST